MSRTIDWSSETKEPRETRKVYSCKAEATNAPPMNEWRCPECDGEGDTEQLALDGGSISCKGTGISQPSGRGRKKQKVCRAHFHWCPRANATVLGPPFHDTPCYHLYHVIRDNDATPGKYDTYSEFVCYAADRDDARKQLPDGLWTGEAWSDVESRAWIPWDSRGTLGVERIGLYHGEVTNDRCITASFHAG